jgi:hypothetical protein
MNKAEKLAEWKHEEGIGNENLLEVGSMNIEVNTFQEKKAAKYVEVHGMENALYRLGQLATRTQRAREMFDIVRRWKEVSEHDIKATTEPRIEPETQMTNQLQSFIRNVQNKPLSPKEQLDQKLSKLDLDYTDAGIDKEWNPVIPVNFQGMNTTFNGKKVWIVKDAMKHTTDLNWNDIDAKFHVYKVTDDRIIGEPDMEAFLAEKERRRTIKEDTFKAVYGRGIYTDATQKDIWVVKGKDTMTEEGVWEMKVLDETTDKVKCAPVRYLPEESYFEAEIGGQRVVHTDRTEKKVWIPKTFLNDLKKDGVWQMKLLKEDNEKVVAKPVKFIKDHPKHITGTPVKEQGTGKDWYNIKTNDTNLHVIVPSKFQRKFRHVQGIWKLEVLDVRNGNIYCKPTKCLTHDGIFVGTCWEQ